MLAKEWSGIRADVLALAKARGFGELEEEAWHGDPGIGRVYYFTRARISLTVRTKSKRGPMRPSRTRNCPRPSS